MLAFTRKPANDGPATHHELLLDEADADLAPLTTSTQRASVNEASRGTGVTPADRGMRLVVAPAWDARELAAYAALSQSVSTGHALFGWRKALFVASGIRLRPTRSERAFRDHVAVLVRCVDPAILYEDKEAAS